MRRFLKQLAFRAIALIVLVLYICAIFGTIAVPAVVAWQWFSPVLPWPLTLIVSITAASLPLMVTAFAMHHDGLRDSKPFWQIWVFGWSALGGALILYLLLE